MYFSEGKDPGYYRIIINKNLECILNIFFHFEVTQVIQANCDLPNRSLGRDMGAANNARIQGDGQGVQTPYPCKITRGCRFPQKVFFPCFTSDIVFFAANGVNPGKYGKYGRNVHGNCRYLEGVIHSDTEVYTCVMTSLYLHRQGKYGHIQYPLG